MIFVVEKIMTAKSYCVIGSKTLRNALILAAGIASVVLAAGPVYADASDDEAKANESGVTQDNVSWMSGGIGDEARDKMRLSRSAYNVHLVFSRRGDGAYLADIPVSITRNNGEEILSGVSEGPLLYLKLPPGSYRISAQIDGATQIRHVSVGAVQSPMMLSFVSRSTAQSDY
jgi:hypothetical protein